jgi:molecular chaperone DnaK
MTQQDAFALGRSNLNGFLFADIGVERSGTQIRIQSSGGLSDADIKRMVREAETNAGADKKRSLFIEAKNHAEAMIHQIEKTLGKEGTTLPPAEKTEAEAAIASASAAMDGDDHDQLTRSQAAIKIEESAHKAQGPTGTPPGGTPGRTAQKKPAMDAEFEEVGR